MPTKQFQLLKATASIKPEVKKQMMMTAPIQAISSSCIAYVVAVEIFSSLRDCNGSIFALREGLGLLELVGVLFSVGAAELNFSRSTLDMDRVTPAWLSMSTKDTADGMMGAGCFIRLCGTLRS